MLVKERVELEEGDAVWLATPRAFSRANWALEGAWPEG